MSRKMSRQTLLSFFADGCDVLSEYARGGEDTQVLSIIMLLRQRSIFVIVIVLVLIFCTFLTEDGRSRDDIRQEQVIPRDVSAAFDDDDDDDDTKETIGDRQNDNETSIWNELAAAQIATLSPTAAAHNAPTASSPTSPETVSPELLPKLPHTAAFNFTVKQADGCFLNMTGNATLTHFPVKHRLDTLVDILSAGMFPPTDTGGHKKKAVCKFRKVGNYMHFPHMMQEFTRCFSFFQTYSNHAPYIVKQSHHRYRYSFNQGINDIFQHV